jgi:CheY-like chemotaxis protein
MNRPAAPVPPGITARRIAIYVEDNPVNARLMSKLLATRRPAIDLLVAPDGRSGLRLITTTDVSLVLLDCHLPDISGLEVLRSLRARGNAVPVVAVTADARPELLHELEAAGINGVITKPFDFDTLLAEVDRFVTPPETDLP